MVSVGLKTFYMFFFHQMQFCHLASLAENFFNYSSLSNFLSKLVLSEILNKLHFWESVSLNCSPSAPAAPVNKIFLYLNLDNLSLLKSVDFLYTLSRK